MLKKKNKHIPANILKKRIIARILRHSELYRRQELAEKSKDQLEEIQDKGLIRLRLILEFKNRANRHIKQIRLPNNCDY
jgi:hypothetical protein